jgi:hypothetical protein
MFEKILVTYPSLYTSQLYVLEEIISNCLSVILKASPCLFINLITTFASEGVVVI